MIEMTPDEQQSELEEAAAKQALEACYRYWQIYTERRCLEGAQTKAVMWLEDNCSGHMMCFTRGEHKQSLKDCISGFDKLDNPFCLY